MFCPHCLLRSVACVCHHAPELASQQHFLLLTHSREISKATNTGRWIARSLATAQIVPWHRGIGIEQTIATPWQQRSAVLLFNPPDADSRPNMDSDSSSDVGADVNAEPAVEEAEVTLPLAEGRLVIVLDGTWQQARKMYRQTPWLQQLPRVRLDHPGSSDFILRRHRHRQPDDLCTLEAVAAVLAACGEPDNARQLLAFLALFQCHAEASRCGHAVVAEPIAGEKLAITTSVHNDDSLFTNR